jgi:hypothetical protein
VDSEVEVAALKENDVDVVKLGEEQELGSRKVVVQNLAVDENFEEDKQHYPRI